MPEQPMTGERQSHIASTVLLLALLAAAPEAIAVPSFARQTGMACEACHTVYPELTHFGRVFKANGYVLHWGQAGARCHRQERGVAGAFPIAPTVDHGPDIVHTAAEVAARSVPNSAPGVAQNGTAGFPQQLSLFYAGKIAPNFGAFFQLTYGSDSGTIGIDNTDLRFADTHGVAAIRKLSPTACRSTTIRPCRICGTPRLRSDFHTRPAAPPYRHWPVQQSTVHSPRTSQG